MSFLWAVTCLAFTSTVSGCGVPAISPSVQYSERIINGQNTVAGSWTWQVSLQARSGSHFCGGSLLSENWVITAAHCEFKAGMRHYNIWQAITHPGWDAFIFNNDITLLKLTSPAQLGPRVSPVCLPPANLALPANLQCVTTGWGRLGCSTNVSLPRCLSTSRDDLFLISSSQGMQYWGNQITTSMLCAGGIGTSSCQGDSGGPLVYQNGNIWTLIGIVSWRNSNCNIRIPAVYTRVSQFQNWINNIVSLE
nr:PREDICTED: LOW QUALITY PROTEIN: chymotrypsin-like protease CTRL-1 [Struthio camelus australis]